jgi:hypothetical protein
MKPFTSAAVYGLVPVPPIPDTKACSDHDNRPLAVDQVNASRLAVMRIELREIAWLASIVISLSILGVSAAVALVLVL